MAFRICLWTDEIVDHLAQHAVTIDDFEFVLNEPDELTLSRSSGRPAAIGRTADGRRLFCVYEVVDDVYVIPCTAYEIED